MDLQLAKELRTRRRPQGRSDEPTCRRDTDRDQIIDSDDRSCCSAAVLSIQKPSPDGNDMNDSIIADIDFLSRIIGNNT